MTQNKIVRALRMCFLSSMLAVMVLLVLPFSASAQTIAQGHAGASPASGVTVKIEQKQTGLRRLIAVKSEVLGWDIPRTFLCVQKQSSQV